MAAVATLAIITLKAIDRASCRARGEAKRWRSRCRTRLAGGSLGGASGGISGAGALPETGRRCGARALAVISMSDGALTVMPKNEASSSHAYHGGGKSARPAPALYPNIIQ